MIRVSSSYVCLRYANKIVSPAKYGVTKILQVKYRMDKMTPNIRF